jgi:hypothetical protein
LGFGYRPDAGGVEPLTGITPEIRSAAPLLPLVGTHSRLVHFRAAGGIVWSVLMLEQRISSAWQHSAWNPHHAPLDPCTRKMIFGPVRPMERPGLLRRLLGS